MMKSPEVDAVVCDTPPNSHKAIVGAALKAGKAVVVEKPLAISLEDGQEWSALD